VLGIQRGSLVSVVVKPTGVIVIAPVQEGANLVESRVRKVQRSATQLMITLLAEAGKYIRSEQVCVKLNKESKSIVYTFEERCPQRSLERKVHILPGLNTPKVRRRAKHKAGV